jgi:hypothetical protein
MRSLPDSPPDAPQTARGAAIERDVKSLKKS